MSENKRTEYVGLYVTPEVKKEIEFSKDNPTIIENIIKRYLSNEKDFVEQELKDIDDASVKYKARLIGIREAFQEANSSYVSEINEIYESGQNILNKLSSSIKSFKDEIQSVQHQYVQFSSFHISQFERILNLMEKFRYMSTEEKEILKVLMEKNNEKQN
mgnify:FL=1